jgi:hypothetical protein
MCESCGFTVFTALRLYFSCFFSCGGCSRAFFSAAEAPWRLFINFCLVHVQIKAVWLVLGARGDVNRRVITYIGWDDLTSLKLSSWSVVGLLVNEKIILIETLLLFLFLYFFIKLFIENIL